MSGNGTSPKTKPGVYRRVRQPNKEPRVAGYLYKMTKGELDLMQWLEEVTASGKAKVISDALAFYAKAVRVKYDEQLASAKNSAGG